MRAISKGSAYPYSLPPSVPKADVKIIVLLLAVARDIFEPMGQYESARRTEEEMKGMKKGLGAFYERQSTLPSPVPLHASC